MYLRHLAYCINLVQWAMMVSIYSADILTVPNVIARPSTAAVPICNTHAAGYICSQVFGRHHMVSTKAV